MDLADARGGMILLDAGEYPVGLNLRDVDVPRSYWQALASLPTVTRSEPPVVEATGVAADHPLRYVLLHELGHALSLYAGEFGLSQAGRFRVARTDGFVRFSWRLTNSSAAGLESEDGSTIAPGVEPRVSLSLVEWASVLNVLESDPALASPGALLWVRPSSRRHARRLCRAATKLTRAGFVTPAAALYPTEDYAETFAHALLAADRRISRLDRIYLDLPHCGVREIRSPYFSPWVTPKRRYLETVLGLARSD
jgi:hypothetical protein